MIPSIRRFYNNSIVEKRFSNEVSSESRQLHASPAARRGFVFARGLGQSPRRRGYAENASASKFKAERLRLGGKLSPS